MESGLETSSLTGTGPAGMKSETAVALVVKPVSTGTGAAAMETGTALALVVKPVSTGTGPVGMESGTAVAEGFSIRHRSNNCPKLRRKSRNISLILPAHSPAASGVI